MQPGQQLERADRILAGLAQHLALDTQHGLGGLDRLGQLPLRPELCSLHGELVAFLEPLLLLGGQGGRWFGSGRGLAESPRHSRQGEGQAREDDRPACPSEGTRSRIGHGARLPRVDRRLRDRRRSARTSVEPADFAIGPIVRAAARGFKKARIVPESAERLPGRVCPGCFSAQAHRHRSRVLLARTHGFFPGKSISSSVPHGQGCQNTFARGVDMAMGSASGRPDSLEEIELIIISVWGPARQRGHCPERDERKRFKA